MRHLTIVWLVRSIWRPFRAHRSGWLFPGLKPWAESCSHLRGMNHWEVTPLQMSKLQSAFGALKAPKFFKIALAGRLTGKRHSLLLAISK
jgi:hypothetical protein